MTKRSLFLAFVGLGAGSVVSGIAMSGCCECDNVFISIDPGDYRITRGFEGLSGGTAKAGEMGDLTMNYQHEGTTYRLVYKLGLPPKPPATP